MQKVNIYDNLFYSEEKVQITPILETEFCKEIRIVFTSGQVMKDHKTSFPISVEILEGQIDFGVGEEIYSLIRGDIVALEGGVMHNLSAKSDSVVRLTLSKSDSINRVKGVLKL